MEARIRKALAAGRADHIEIRLEQMTSSTVRYTGEDLEDIGARGSAGGCVRALVNGGWGFVSFNDAAELDRYVRLACEQAAMVGCSQRALAPVPAVVDSVINSVIEDPRKVSLEEKERLVRGYNEIIRKSPRIQTSSANYTDVHSVQTIATSEGAFVRQETVYCRLMLVGVARDGVNVQQAFESVGDLKGFQIVRGLEAKCEDVAKRAADLLSAQPVEGGRYTVICDPKLTGVFVHEAFGHLSESDFLYENPDMLEMMAAGKRFGVDDLSIVDDPTLPDEAGSYEYDDEGTPASKTWLIRNGLLCGHLHSRETAAQMGEAPTGNARALGYSNAPIVRMSNTYLEPRESSLEEMIADIDNGIYAVGALGGMTDAEMFTFSAGEAYAIRDGKLAGKLRDVVLTGNVKETLMNIDAIGSDLEFTPGGCGKGGQSPLRVSTGGPHIRIRNVVIGGRQ